MMIMNKDESLYEMRYFKFRLAVINVYFQCWRPKSYF